MRSCPWRATLECVHALGVQRRDSEIAAEGFKAQAQHLKDAEIRQPWVVNGHNTHTPDSREACQAIAFYDNFIPEK